MTSRSQGSLADDEGEDGNDVFGWATKGKYQVGIPFICLFVNQFIQLSMHMFIA